MLNSNTTLVSINLTQLDILEQSIKYSNTTLVSINHGFYIKALKDTLYSNTTLVSINPYTHGRI